MMLSIRTTHNITYQQRCKRCGKGRYHACEYALCEQHYLEYTQKVSKAYYNRKTGKVTQS